MTAIDSKLFASPPGAFSLSEVELQSREMSPDISGEAASHSPVLVQGQGADSLSLIDRNVTKIDVKETNTSLDRVVSPNSGDESSNALSKKELQGTARMRALFFDPKGGPKPWQCVSQFAQTGAAAGVILTAAVSILQPSEEDPACPCQNNGSKTLAYGVLASAVGSIAGGVFGAVTFNHMAGPVYE